ncbi:hypothetical protein [Vreelandella neptunia]|uniref:Uncharacterized protein n=1 Tax=Vreelandella neptunia TaxID=115551 RepID=A0ABZ0YTI1_9GAMM|nr:hypothetical protein [Halomonas neptunia]MDN3561695.1 hypothetical protein [Halomonas neptunia]WQH14597.1 hypothetical protein SR894_08670 [Halomonas neptunia]
MPLIKVERQVLEVICEEHRQTHRGAKVMIVYVGMNAKTVEQKARIAEVLHALEKSGLLVAREGAWLPTLSGSALLSPAAAEPTQDKAPAGCDKCGVALCAWDAKQYGEICNSCFKDLEESPIAVETTAKPAPPSLLPVDAAHMLSSELAPDDLINRCAAMNATLMAQAKQAHYAGDPEAWRDLRWLMETAQQLVKLGGGS